MTKTAKTTKTAATFTTGQRVLVTRGYGKGRMGTVASEGPRYYVDLDEDPTQATTWVHVTASSLKVI